MIAKLVGMHFMHRGTPHEIISVTYDRKYCSIKNTKTGQEYHMVALKVDDDIDIDAIPVKCDGISFQV